MQKLSTKWKLEIIYNHENIAVLQSEWLMDHLLFKLLNKKQNNNNKKYEEPNHDIFRNKTDTIELFLFSLPWKEIDKFLN